MDETIQVRLLDNAFADRTVEVAVGEGGGPPLAFEFDYVPPGTSGKVVVEYEITGHDLWGMPEYRAIGERRAA